MNKVHWYYKFLIVSNIILVILMIFDLMRKITKKK